MHERQAFPSKLDSVLAGIDHMIQIEVTADSMNCAGKLVARGDFQIAQKDKTFLLLLLDFSADPLRRRFNHLSAHRSNSKGF